MRAISHLSIAVVLASILAAASLDAAEFYVATTGNDTNPGTEALPFASIARGQTAASGGDTVWLRGGTYAFSGTTGGANAVLFNKSGTNGNRINYFSYPGETPVFDFFNYLPMQRIRGFSVQADWLHFRGLELRGVQQTLVTQNESWAIRVEGNGGGDNNIFEQLNLHHNEGPGLFILNGGNNLVLNSDSHHNYDPDRGGENADGFGSHSNDNGNVFVGNRAWWNSDDGYDFINSPGVVVIENSWAWRNGYIPDTTNSAGNGAGIKAGGFLLDPNNFPDPEDVPRNIVRGNLSFNNRVQGFYANHHPGGIDWLNNTSYGNSRGFDLIADVEPQTWPAHHFLRNNIAFSNNTNLVNATQADIDDEFNTWNAGFAASSADFLSLSSSGVDGPRQPDGSLPELDFMRLAATSGLINAGQFVGLPYGGSAPDLGAFETGLAGDFNNDGSVDAADYTTWRNGLGAAFTAADYEVWKTHFGETTLESGLGATGSASASLVPEPAGIYLFAFGFSALIARRRIPIRSRDLQSR